MIKRGIILVLLTTSVLAQNNRLNTHNNIGWYNLFATFNVSKKNSLHTEYQFRRDNWITNWQQSLLRLGLNHQFNSRVQLRIGAAWIETFPYGDIPINSFGKDFTEWRTYQQITINDNFNSLSLSHRFMLEQRWIGRYSSALLDQEDDYQYLNRIRYMARVQIPLSKKDKNSFTYLAAYDEIFLGFGNQIGENIFDQNRLGIMVGKKFNKNIRMELGYLNQILQYAREINSSNSFQHNNGFILNTFLDF
jgi:hypothetical protein